MLLIGWGNIQAEPEAIFDGKSLKGWRVQGAPYWNARDGILVGQSDGWMKNSVLWTEKSYADFALEFDFRFTGDIDSGVFLREENFQIQIGASRTLKRDMTGSPYVANQRGYAAEAQGISELMRAGDWNRMRIIAKGGSYRVLLNDIKVMEHETETHQPAGPLGLQVHPGVMMKIEFRDIQIEET